MGGDRSTTATSPAWYLLWCQRKQREAGTRELRPQGSQGFYHEGGAVEPSDEAGKVTQSNSK